MAMKTIKWNLDFEVYKYLRIFTFFSLFLKKKKKNSLGNLRNQTPTFRLLKWPFFVFSFFFPELFSWTLKIPKIKKGNPYKVRSGKTNLVGNILAAKALEQVQTHTNCFFKKKKKTYFLTLWGRHEQPF